MTSRLPSHSTSSAPKPRKQRHARIERALQPNQHAIPARGTLRSRAKPLELVRLLPVRAHDADARQCFLHDRADARTAAPEWPRTAGGSRCRSTARESDTNGSGISAISVSRRSIVSMSTIATMNTSTVFAEYMMAGPIIMRTALRSFVARDIRSPVRWTW